MILKMKNESDGRCFAYGRYGCRCLTSTHEECGTYRCGFYKPADCKDWIRIDRKNSVLMLTPEEAYEE